MRFNRGALARFQLQEGSPAYLFSPRLCKSPTSLSSLSRPFARLLSLFGVCSVPQSSPLYPFSSSAQGGEVGAVIGILFSGFAICFGTVEAELFAGVLVPDVFLELRCDVLVYCRKGVLEQYGDIRSLYTSCKHKGFVMIYYYDMRSARNAMRALQNMPLRRRKLDIHFSIPKDNPSDKDVNQGTLVIFNLDPSVSNDDLKHIFGAYGEVKEIRETPHRLHHKFIEFYDVRAAESALRSLNKSDLAGKRIKLEPIRPGGDRRILMQQMTHDFEQDKTRGYWHHMDSPIINSPPGPWGQISSPNHSSPLDVFTKIVPIGKDKIEVVSLIRKSMEPASYMEYGFIPKSPEISFTNHIAFGNIGVNQNDLSFMNITPRATMNQGMMSGNMPDNGSPNMGMMPAHRFGPLLFRNAAYPGPTSIGFDGFVDWNRSRRVDNHGNQVDNKQYQLDLDRIINGEDARTTIMIKNIPNKWVILKEKLLKLYAFIFIQNHKLNEKLVIASRYTPKMLLAAIDETHKGTYDFFVSSN
ncbi:hypothetical protein ZIOFF_066360 [Zingiber officinale]|uniref:RRM domain-containing protein n=1 Tax=Zingiber officinale TaxID=94328 RepID=A0A8J5KDS1_ZINOF|nr:hypothetical protein ZIOFF_066360 [Zingiber officinale]